MRVMVFGASGMLGGELMLALGEAGHEGRGPSRGRCDITDADAVAHALHEFRPEVAINAAGVFDAAGKWPVPRASDYLRVNALGPHVLAEMCKLQDTRLVHVSTDCVFSGKASAGRAYYWNDPPSPTTLYGRSKLAGEPEGEHVTVVRTSFIGPRHGVWSWFAGLPRRSVVSGWRKARWSGSTAPAVAQALAGLCIGGRTGIVHLATPRAISKYELLVLLREAFDRRDITITGVETPYLNRALMPSPGVDLLPAAEAIEEYMHAR